MPMAGACTARPVLRADPTPPAPTLAEVPGENEPWWESGSGLCVWGTRKMPRIRAPMFGSGWEGSARAVAGRDP